MIEVTYNIIGNFMLCSCNRSNIGLVIFQVSILHYISEIISVKRFRTIDGNIIYMCSYPQGKGQKIVALLGQTYNLLKGLVAQCNLL